MRRCQRIHRYVIALGDSISDTFNTPEEARDFINNLGLKNPTWVAFHEVSIKQLVDHPDTIETYCALETEDLENPSGVDLTKRS